MTEVEGECCSSQIQFHRLQLEEFWCGWIWYQCCCRKNVASWGLLRLLGNVENCWGLWSTLFTRQQWDWCGASLEDSLLTAGKPVVNLPSLKLTLFKKHDPTISGFSTQSSSSPRKVLSRRRRNAWATGWRPSNSNSHLFWLLGFALNHPCFTHAGFSRIKFTPNSSLNKAVVEMLLGVALYKLLIFSVSLASLYAKVISCARTWHGTIPSSVQVWHHVPADGHWGTAGQLEATAGWSAPCPRLSSPLVSVHSHMHMLSNSYSLRDPASTMPVHEVGFWSAVICDVSFCLFLLHLFFMFCLMSFSSVCLVNVSKMSIVLQDRWQLGYNVASQLGSVPTWPWTGTPGVTSWSWSTTSWYTSHLVTPPRKMAVHHRSTSGLFETNCFCVFEKRN